MNVISFAEMFQNELSPVSFELLHLANSIKGDDSGEAVILGKELEAESGRLAEYSDKVSVIEDDDLVIYNPELYVDVLYQLIKDRAPAIILFADTPAGKEIAPCLAAKLEAPIQTDVVSAAVSDQITVSKFIFQGNAMMDMELAPSNFYVLTVKQGTFTEGPAVNGVVEKVELTPTVTPRRTFLSITEPEIGEVDISSHDVVVTVGKGIGDQAKIEQAEELASLVGGVTAGTRPIIDYGWLPRDRQVGLSGRVIGPKLYLGLGASGASHHVMGMKDSQLIVAINKDAEAPIFRVADYGVAGDLKEILPELIKQLQELKG